MKFTDRRRRLWRYVVCYGVMVNVGGSGGEVALVMVVTYQ